MAVATLASRINTTDTYNLRTHMKWRTVISHLKSGNAKRIMTITPDIAVRYVFDYYGLLKQLGIPEYYHYPTLLLNGFHTPTQYVGNILEVTVADSRLLEQYKIMFTKNP